MKVYFGAHIREAAKLYGLDPELVAAIIFQESSGDPFAIRPEPAFFDRYLRNKYFNSDIEARARACSWGLMQTMGQTAREFGYREPLTTLLEPRRNILLGCKIFRQFLSEKGSEEAALLRWNGGGDKKYPAKVLAHRKNGNAQKMLD